MTYLLWTITKIVWHADVSVYKSSNLIMGLGTCDSLENSWFSYKGMYCTTGTVTVLMSCLNLAIYIYFNYIYNTYYNIYYILYIYYNIYNGYIILYVLIKMVRNWASYFVYSFLLECRKACEDLTAYETQKVKGTGQKTFFWPSNPYMSSSDTL